MDKWVDTAPVPKGQGRQKKRKTGDNPIGDLVMATAVLSLDTARRTRVLWSMGTRALILPNFESAIQKSAVRGTDTAVQSAQVWGASILALLNHEGAKAFPQALQTLTEHAKQVSDPQLLLGLVMSSGTRAF